MPTPSKGKTAAPPTYKAAVPTWETATRMDKDPHCRPDRQIPPPTNKGSGGTPLGPSLPAAGEQEPPGTPNQRQRIRHNSDYPLHLPRRKGRGMATARNP